MIMPNDEEVLTFLRKLWFVEHGLRKISRGMKRRVGISGPERLVLRVIGKNPGISPKGVAKVLHVHPSTLTGVLKALERRRLVSRKPHAVDNRQFHFNLTHRGRGTAANIQGTVEDSVRRALKGISKREICDAGDVLERLGAELARLTRPV